MSIAHFKSRAQQGLDAPSVLVEAYVGGGTPKFSIVGLPETALRESRDRVRAAIKTCGFDFPDGRVTINLSPADMPKMGGRYDLAIALGLLVASKQLICDVPETLEFYGELGLTGILKPIRGALAVTLAALKSNHSVILPKGNESEASLVKHADIQSAHHLLDVCDALSGTRILSQVAFTPPPNINYEKDLSDVRGQALAKRALTIAAAGGHSVLFIGPPGSGKTMLAERLSGILPHLTEEQALTTAAIHALSHGEFDFKQWRVRPFRNPHHTASPSALIGGGSKPVPGELSLAHNGVLFLDELPEFQRRVLETMRQPLEDGKVIISRATERAEYPADVQLIAAMNPCPCGFLGDPHVDCRCSPGRIEQYQQRISGPLLDRIDMHVHVERTPHTVLSTHTKPDGESSKTIAKQVNHTHALQTQRQGYLNKALTAKDMTTHCVLDTGGQSLLDTAADRFHLSARAYVRIIKLARTIADLDKKASIKKKHVAEAIHLRCLDRQRR